MDYEGMSNRSISLKIFEIKYGRLGSDKDMLRVWGGGKIDYCDNPADMWPIIVENKITVYGSGAASVMIGDYEMIESHQNPLRAAAIVYLMMMENKGA